MAYLSEITISFGGSKWFDSGKLPSLSEVPIGLSQVNYHLFRRFQMVYLR